MNDMFLNYFDQTRFIFGMIAASFIFSFKVGQLKKPILVRFLTSIILGTSFVNIWIHLLGQILTDYDRLYIWGYRYIVMCCVLQFIIVWLCFDIPIYQAILCCILGRATEGVVTVLLRYIVILMYQPQIQQEHFGIYIAIMAVVYIVVYGLANYLFGKKISACIITSISKKEEIKLTVTHSIIYVGFMLAFSIIQNVLEYILEPLSEYEELNHILLYVRFLMIIVLLVLCILILLMLITNEQERMVRRERDVFDRLVHEKKEQYEMIKENTDIINGQCHEIRKRLLAMEQAKDSEREKLMDQALEAINIYDAVVKTGNEVIDTILTQRSILCANHGIKLSCMVNVEETLHIDIVDLFAILDEALSNAINAVDTLKEKNKKLVNLILKEYGNMLYITVENYYSGEVKLDEINQTKKNRHTRGLNTIHYIVNKNNGTMNIELEQQIFLLQILLPYGKN